MLKKRISKSITVISPTSRLKLGWDFLVMIVVLYKFFCISIHVCFYSIPLSYDIFSSSSFPLNVSENIIMVVVMLLDILLTLNMAYYENGTVVDNRKLIKKKYISTHFVFDLLPLLACFVQFILVVFHLDEQLIYVVFACYIFFLPKYKDISKTWGDVEELFYTDEKREAIFSLLILFFETLVSAHVSACIWHGIAFWFDIGVSFKEDAGFNWLLKSGISEESWGVKYLNSMYFAVTTMITVGYGDITPTNNIEKFFCIIFMLLGCIVFGYAINRIGVILEKIGKFNTEIK